MKIVFGFLLLLAGPASAETYNECILNNMKGIGSNVGANLVRRACKDKVLPHIPAKCIRKLVQINETPSGNPFDRFDKARPHPASRYRPGYVEVVDQGCINSCLNASFWSKRFGDCSP
jgi:hypothetical protein